MYKDICYRHNIQLLNPPLNKIWQYLTETNLLNYQESWGEVEFSVFSFLLFSPHPHSVFGWC